MKTIQNAILSNGHTNKTVLIYIPYTISIKRFIKISSFRFYLEIVRVLKYKCELLGVGILLNKTVFFLTPLQCALIFYDDSRKIKKKLKIAFDALFFISQKWNVLAVEEKEKRKFNYSTI